MRKLILSLLLILCLAFQASAWNIMIVGSGSEDFTDIEFWINFENYSAAQTYTLHASNDYSGFGDDTATFGDDAEVNVGAALQGSYGLDCVDDGADGVDFISFTMSSGARQAFANEGRIGLYAKIPTGGWTNDTFIITVKEDATDTLSLHFDDTDELKFRWITEYPVTTNSPISDNTLYFIEVAWDATPANGSDYVEIWVDGVSKHSDSTLSMTADAIIPVLLQIGNVAANSGDTLYDVVVLSNDKTRDLHDLVVTRGIVNYPG